MQASAIVELMLVQVNRVNLVEGLDSSALMKALSIHLLDVEAAMLAEEQKYMKGC
jgi:hypothetical protein